jgi:hypothetical protein
MSFNTAFNGDSYINPIEILDTTVSTASDGSLLLYGGLTIFNTSPAVSLFQGGGITSLGGLSINSNSIFNGNVSILYTDNATSVTNGALTIAGGVVIQKNLLMPSGGASMQNLTVANAIVTGTLSASSFSPSNINTSNISSGTLNLSSGLTSASAQITNANITSLTAGSLSLLNVVTNNITTGTLVATNMQIINGNTLSLTVGSSVVTNALSTNITSSTLNLSVGLTSASAQITNANITSITSANVTATSYTGGSMQLSGGATMGALQFSTTSISVPRIMLNGGDSTNVYHGFGVGPSSMRISVPSSGSHYIAFGSNSAGNFAEQMRLQNNGNVGINTANPNYTLDVAGNVNFTGNLTQNGSAFGGASQWSTFGNNIAYTKGNVGIGTTSPGYALDVNGSIRTTSIYSGSSQVIYNNSGTFTYGAPSGNYARFANGGGSASLGLQGSVSVFTGGNVGIGTASPSYPLDVNGTIARSGVALPRFDNGSASGSASFTVPILFSDSTYNYAEVKVRYISSAVCTLTLSAKNSGNTQLFVQEMGVTTAKWNSMSSPDYQTSNGSTSGTFAVSVEQTGVDSMITFRVVRAANSGNRNTFSYNHAYCWTGIGAARAEGVGYISGTQLASITFTSNTGTLSGTYSTEHSY